MVLPNDGFFPPQNVSKCKRRVLFFPLFLFYIGAFKLWCWRRLLRVPWTARRSNQLIIKEVNPEYSLERLMLKLKL